MDSFGSVSTEPLPPWIEYVKDKARTKITSAAFAAQCRNGNKAAMRGLIIGLWPFIDEFPVSMIRGAGRISRIGLLRKRELQNTLLHRGPKLLVGVKGDEENHRKLWLQSGTALGLRYPEDFNGPAIPETQAWIDAINTEGDASTFLYRFAAIEMIAEIVSVELLTSEAFTSILGKEGCEWFRVHAEHEDGMSHEELELRLAFALSNGNSIKDYASTVILNIVDLGVRAIEVSARLELSADKLLLGD